MVNDNPITQRVEQFHLAHGGNDVAIAHEGYWYYPDGAAREVNIYGALLEPSTDPVQRAKDIVFYHKTKLSLAVRRFSAAKQDLVQFANCAAQGTIPIGPSEEDFKKLEALQAEVKLCQKTLREAEDPTRDATADRASMWRMEGRELGKSLLDRAHSIKI